MNKSGFAFVFLLLVALSAASVVVLTPDNIDSVLGDDKNGILVKFYAPWCGHCKKIAPEYEAAAADLKAEGSKVVLAEADCDAHRVIGEQYQIQGYPTLKWFRNGKIQDYSGGRTRPEIVSWIKRNTLDQLNEVDAINPPTLPTYGLVVLFGKDNEGVYQELLKGARTIDDLVFAQASKSLIESQGLKTGTVVVYKPDGSSQLFEASDDILDKISTFAYPKYVEFSQAQFSRLSQQKEAIIFGFAPYTDEEAVATLKSYLNTAADKHSNVGFLYGDSAVFARGLSGAGASLNFLPTFVAIYNQRQLVWDEEVPLTAESLSNWIDNVFQGTAATNKKSEPLPESNDGPVVKLVYKNYDTYMNSGKPIFVKYYAPWCGHCKNMAADWIKLGETVKKVTIAEYDATANYAEVEPIEGFPTIIFYDGKGGKETYNGERSFDALLSFVNEKIQTHHDEL